MNTMRFESRAGRVTAGIDPRLPKLAVAMLAVFLGYFAIGRVADTHSSRAGATSSLSTLFHSGAAPIVLGAAPPIASAVSARRPIGGTGKRQASAIRATAAHKQPITRAVSSAPLRSARQEQSVPVPSPSAKAPSPPVSAPPASAPPASVPSKSAPSASAPPASAPSTGGSSSGGGHSGSSQGGGGSFDSSG
jgi:uncharacterized membrane protein YgcG